MGFLADLARVRRELPAVVEQLSKANDIIDQLSRVGSDQPGVPAVPGTPGGGGGTPRTGAPSPSVATGASGPQPVILVDASGQPIHLAPASGVRLPPAPISPGVPGRPRTGTITMPPPAGMGGSDGSTGGVGGVDGSSRESPSRIPEQAPQLCRRVSRQVWLGRQGPFTQNGWNCSTKEALGAGIGPNPFSPDGIYWESVPELDRTIDMESSGRGRNTARKRKSRIPTYAYTYLAGGGGPGLPANWSPGRSSTTGGSQSGGTATAPGSSGISSSDSGVQAIVGAVRDVSKEVGNLRRELARGDGGIDFRTGRIA